VRAGLIPALSGPVTHLLRDGGKLYAATELGDHLVWNLAPLNLGYCEVMRRVWKSIAVVWRDGKPVTRPPPPHHRCSGHSSK
jgi:hypothetical protein